MRIGDLPGLMILDPWLRVISRRRTGIGQLADFQGPNNEYISIDIYGESPAVAKRLPDSNQRTVSLDGAADDDVSQANSESRAPTKPRGPFCLGLLK